MANNDNSTILGPEDGKVVLAPGHKIIHKASGEDTGGAYSMAEVCLEGDRNARLPGRASTGSQVGGFLAVAFGVAECPFPVRPAQILAIRCCLGLHERSRGNIGRSGLRGEFKNGFGADRASSRIRLRRGIRQLGHGLRGYHW